MRVRRVRHFRPIARNLGNASFRAAGSWSIRKPAPGPSFLNGFYRGGMYLVLSGKGCKSKERLADFSHLLNGQLVVSVAFAYCGVPCFRRTLLKTHRIECVLLEGKPGKVSRLRFTSCFSNDSLLSRVLHLG